ncbi:ABC transporter permease subunit [Actinocorallia aurea]
MSGELRAAAAAEWTRLTTVRSTWWTLAAAAVVMAASCAQMGIIHANENTDDLADNDSGVHAVGAVAIDSFTMGQFVLFALVVLSVSAEYAGGGIRWTFQAVPVRGRVFLAKALVLAPVMFVAGSVLCLLGALAALPLLGEWGTLDGLVGDALVMGVYSAFMGVLTLAIVFVLRSAAGALSALFVLLILVPIFAMEAEWPAAEALPSLAGSVFMSGVSDPYPPAAGLAIVIAWTVAASLGAVQVLRRRDV